MRADTHERFGPYELVAKIGEGGMAEVFRARFMGPGGFEQRLVVKRMLPHLSDNQDSRAMFLAEAKLLGGLRHPNIVRIHELGQVGSQLYMAMELVEGFDLAKMCRELIRGNQWPGIPEVLQIVSGVLEGLAHAHSQVSPDGQSLRIVHRDMTPSNVLISRSGEVKICDFGIARSVFSRNRTRAGQVRGKLHYMAPEQVCAEPLDHRTDLYAVGMILHALLSGRHPFHGEKDERVVQRLLVGDVPPPSDFETGVPPQLDAIVARAVALDPASRFQSADEFGSALDEFAWSARIRTGPRSLARLLESVTERPEVTPAPWEGVPVHESPESGWSVTRRATIHPLPSYVT